jgi:hypothetical protein
VNIQHSSRTDRWYTPLDVIVRAQKVLGNIDLDPATDEFGNARVGATYILTEKEDGLVAPWVSGTVFLNPPGGKRGNKSLAGLFWERLMKHREAGGLDDAIFLAFSAEALQSTQGKGYPSIGEFAFCVPKKRLRFDYPSGAVGGSPSHSNVIVYVPGNVSRETRFWEAFHTLGVICNL